jgi:hypothetical protein
MSGVFYGQEKEIGRRRKREKVSSKIEGRG